MCFAPIVSISTTIVEFLLAGVLLFYFDRSRLRDFFILFIVMLGFYQFSEFMICTSSSSHLWAMIGIATYSFLPAVGLHAVMNGFKKKANLFWIYVVPVIAVGTMLVVPNFVIKTTCADVFIHIKTVMTLGDSLLLTSFYYIYLAYYAVFIAYAAWLIYEDYKVQKNEIRREIELVELAGLLLMTVPVFVFIFMFPLFGIMFPSILCQFAIFVAIAAFVAVYLESKIKKRSVRK